MLCAFCFTLAQKDRNFSDIGIQYASKDFREYLKKYAYVQNMSRKGTGTCYNHVDVWFIDTEDSKRLDTTMRLNLMTDGTGKYEIIENTATSEGGYFPLDKFGREETDKTWGQFFSGANESIYIKDYADKLGKYRNRDGEVWVDGSHHVINFFYIYLPDDYKSQTTLRTPSQRGSLRLRSGSGSHARAPNHLRRFFGFYDV